MGLASYCSVLVALLACTVGYFASTKEHFFYRLSTTLKAIYELQLIPPERVNNFLKAYEMFELQSMTNSEEHMKWVKDYYETLNHLCAIGNYEKMYLPPMRDPSKDTYTNQRLYEKRMMSQLKVGPGSHVLDIACGRGRIANYVATETGANVTGINIDKDQLRQAREYAVSQGLTKQLQFVEANYNDRLPFPDNHFDAVYYVQVIGGYGTDMKKFYSEVNRVLKPGGYAAFEDYIILPKYNDEDPLHRRYVQASKAILGVAEYITEKEYLDALSYANLDIIYRQNGSVAEQFLLLEQDRDFFLPVTAVVTKMNSWGLIPQHFADMMQRMTKGTEDCIEAHRQHLVTGDIETVVQKKT
jgi:sterol 24-C-methyltransferase